MNRILWAIGILSLLAAGLLAIWPPPAQAPVTTKGIPSPEDSGRVASDASAPAPRLCGSDCAHDHHHHHHGTGGHGPECRHDHGLGSPSPAAVLPSTLPSSLLPAAALCDFAMATGRALDAAVPQALSDQALCWPALPRRGTAELLVRSTLGGMDAQRHLACAWSLNPDGAIRCTGISGQSPDTVVDMAIVAGAWTCSSGPIEPALLSGLSDLSRTITALHGAQVSGGTIPVGSTLTLADENCTLWSAVAGTWMIIPSQCASAPPAMYPLTAGAWNDWRIQLDPSGAWIAAERLMASPASDDEPGFLVRRVMVR